MRKTIDLDGGMDTEIMNASIFGQQGFLAMLSKIKAYYRKVVEAV